MTRQRRINAPGTIHHVVNRGVNRQPIFFGDPDRIEFGRLLGEIHDRYGVKVIAYCLMDNHYHLILDCPNGHLSEAMHHLQSVLASHVNQRTGRDGPLLKGRFYSALIRTDAYLLTATRYVERNALAVAGVIEPWDYRWSSVRARLGFKAGPTWLQTDRILEYFPDRDAYATFLRTAPTVDESTVIVADALDATARLMVTLFADDGVRTAQVERTVIAASAHQMTERNQQLIAAHLGFADTTVLRRATTRALARIADEPSLGVAVAEFRRATLDSAKLNTTIGSAA